MRDKLLTTKEAAGRLGLSMRTVQRMCRDHKIEHTRPWGNYLIWQSAVEELAAVVPATTKRRQYRKDPRRERQDDHELIERLMAVKLEQVEEVPAESILSPLEQLQDEWMDKIKNAASGDHARLLKDAMDNAVRDHLKQEADRDKARPKGHYPNPEGF